MSTTIQPNKSDEVFLVRMLVIQLFGLLTAGGYYFLWWQQNKEQISPVFEHHCPADWRNAGPLGARQHFTGLAALDDIACLLVTFFHPLLVPADYLVKSFILALPAAWFAVLLDSASLFPDSPLLSVGLPLLDGLIVQLKGGGVGLPIYWLFSLVSRAKLRTEGRVPAHADRQHILAAFLAVVLGGVIPTFALVANPEVHVIALWQPFPIYIAVLQAVLLLILPSSHANKPKVLRDTARQSQDPSAIGTARFAWAILALLPSYSYYQLLSKAAESGSPFRYFLDLVHATAGKITYDSVDAALRTGVQDEARRFIRWDIVFIGAATWFAGALSGAADTFGQFVLLIVASIIGTAAFGPGVLTATPFLYGLSRDEKKRPALVDGKKVE